MADDNDTFVTIGTSFDIPEEDAPKKKALPIHEQFATDKEGRRRFHGAFTGGFSAGYFNTVGSKEGWKPTSFVSSRSKRLHSSYQKPEDFMDEDDLDQFGIAPRNVETTKLFSRETETSEKRCESVERLEPDFSLDSMVRVALEHLVVPCRMSIGVKLLNKMGWKEGQGIGPRVRQLSKKKVYGCVVPSGNETENDEHDVYAEGLLFAPKDTKSIKFVPKDNLHGIGYKGMLAPSAPIAVSKPGYSGSLKIKGQAFGVGAFEEEDDDVYTQDSISNYDIELHDRKSTQSHYHGWTGPPNRSEKGGALSNFSQASKPRPANKVFSPPSIPKGYQPFASVKENYIANPDNVETGKRSSRHLTSDERGQLLGEKPLPKPVKSVFDLMSKGDRDRIVSVKGPSEKETSFAVSKTDALTKPLLTQKSLRVGSSGFQPFAKDPAKQARYESFLESRKSNKETNIPNELCGGLTEWERVREKEEFSRSAMLFQPLKGTMAARFARGRNIDDEPNISYDGSSKDTESVQGRAAEMEMFGKLTRNTLEWHPAKLLCKRFNIPEPYPSSKTVGLIEDKKEKFDLGRLFKSSADDTDQRLSCTRSPSTTSRETTSPQLLVSPETEHEKPTENREDTLVATSSGSTVPPTASNDQDQERKLSMDLFKAIFASSSEDESEKSQSEDEREENEEHGLPLTSVTLNPDVNVLSKQQTFSNNKSLKDVPNLSETLSIASKTKTTGEEDNKHENTMEVDELEYGPKPPPQSKQTENIAKLELQPRQTVPFSSCVSENKSEHSRSKSKKKRKHKHKQKEKDKLSKSHDCQMIQHSRNTKHIEKSKQTQLPDDKEILSKLKAVQGRRMRAADFM